MKFTEAAFRALEHEMIEFASYHHRHHTYGGDKPYTYHLRAVRDAVYRFMPYIPFGVSVEVLVISAWGHDLKEDCGVTAQELISRFGEEVEATIESVSDEPGKNRKERKVATLQKTAKSPGGIFLKLMDRIVNIEAGGKTDMYRKEHLEFKAALYTPGSVMEPIWVYLDSLLAA